MFCGTPDKQASSCKRYSGFISLSFGNLAQWSRKALHPETPENWVGASGLTRRWHWRPLPWSGKKIPYRRLINRYTQFMWTFLCTSPLVHFHSKWIVEGHNARKCICCVYVHASCLVSPVWLLALLVGEQQCILGLACTRWPAGEWKSRHVGVRFHSVSFPKHQLRNIFVHTLRNVASVRWF